MSDEATIARPEPSAAPLMAAITGLAHSRIAWKHSRVRREWAIRSPGCLMFSARPFRSAPAQNTLPAPVSTTARISGVSEMMSSACVSSSFRMRVRALTGGLSSVSTATWPSMRTFSWV